MKRIVFLILLIASFYKVLAQGTTSDTINYLIADNWDNSSEWYFSKMTGATAGSISDYSGLNNDGIKLSYSFPEGGAWVNTEMNLTSYSIEHPIVLFVYSTTDASDLELKFIDHDGSVFGVKIPLSNFHEEWSLITVFQDNTEYWWGGDSNFDTPDKFSIAISGSQSGNASVFIDEAGIGKTGFPSTIVSTIDPNYALTGTGFLQRRDSIIETEDPLVLEYIKELQEYSSVAGKLLSTYKGGVEAQTFNNSLAALAFIVKNEKERVERILDFYQSATDSSNTDIRKQNFFVNGKARGFYQQAVISTGLDERNSDRWIGDMAWLLIACKNYELRYDSHRYDYLITLIRDLLNSFYIDSGIGGYIRSGWRHGDSYLHESNGHHEGNIDCYVALKLCGDEYYAHKIKLWLDKELNGQTALPLDLYTWRCLAFGAIDESYISLLNIPEYDFRYRKIIHVNGTDVMGMYSSPDISINNFWNDGTGHISCVFQAFGDKQRGYFYANQLDQLIIPQVFGSNTVHGIPYTLNEEGYPGVDPSVPVISCSAWYILAKNGYNPFLSGEFADITLNNGVISVIDTGLSQIYPNPFSESITVDFTVLERSFVTIDIYNMQGAKVYSLLNKYLEAGSYSAHWNGETNSGVKTSPGIYHLSLMENGYTDTKTIIYMPSSRK